MSGGARELQFWLNRIWYGTRVPPLWLRALAIVYGAVAAARRFAYAHGWRATRRTALPLIVVGNLSVGGTGKTPLVCWLTERLVELGFRPGIVARGYGGSARDARLLAPGDTPQSVGDESILLAQRTGQPVAIGRDRPAAVQLLQAAGCDVVVSDDGLQHYRMARDCEIVVLDAQRGFGNGWLLPAGPLRETAQRAARADALVVNGGEDPGVLLRMRLEASDAVRVDGQGRVPLATFAGQAVHALAGIGNPQRFFELLRSHGIEVQEHALPDHARIEAGDLEFGDTRPVLMTEKDAVKCRHLAGPRHWYVPVSASFAAPAKQALLALVQRAIDKRAARA